jgi:hypothetical protein
MHDLAQPCKAIIVALLLLFLLIAFTSCTSPVQTAGTGGEEQEYDHETTLIPSRGAHRGLVCEACHVDDDYEKKLPASCSGCHNDGIALGTPPGHMTTGENCDVCHNTATFRIPLNASRVTQFDHDSTGFALDGSHRTLACNDCHRNGVFRGTPTRCMNCHNKLLAPGKPPEHLTTSLDCGECHGQWTFNVNFFDHINATGACYSCHNGVTATGKPVNHFTDSITCEDCHYTTAWVPSVFDHSGISAGCINCHNGVRVNGKPASHPLTSNLCEACHRTQAWLPLLRMDHAETTAGCVSCHNNQVAPGQSPSHIPTTMNCAACHNTVSWVVSAPQVDHNEIPLAASQCASCHEPERPPSNHPKGGDCINCHVAPPVGDWCSQPVSDQPGLC